jgi:hypothetical protein
MALETQTDTRKEDGLITIQCWAENDRQTGIFPVNVFYPSLWGNGSHCWGEPLLEHHKILSQEMTFKIS